MAVTAATRKITKLRVREMSLVPEGDNPHADVLILKHRQIAGVDLDVAKETLAEVRKGALAIAKALSEGGSPMNIEELTGKLEGIEKALETAQTDNATQKARITELEGQVSTVTKERDDAVAEVTKAKAAAPGATDEEIFKGMPDAAVAEIKKARKDAEEARAEVEKARDEREEGTEIEKVRGTGLTDADKFGKLVHRVRKGKSTTEDADALVELLTKAAAVAKGGEKLFTAIGKAKGDAIEGDEAEIAKRKLDEVTDTILKAKPTLTREQASAEAMDKNPALYDAMCKKS